MSDRKVPASSENHRNFVEICRSNSNPIPTSVPSGKMLSATRSIRSAVHCRSSPIVKQTLPLPAQRSTRCHAIDSSIGVVICDHGSRRKDSNDMLFEFGELYKQMSGSEIVEMAHMEIAEPTIAQAIGMGRAIN